MVQYLPIIAGALGALCLVLLTWGFHLATAEQQVVGGVPVREKKQKSDEDFLLFVISELVGRPFRGIVLGIIGTRGAASVRRRIAAANRSGRMTVERYASRKAGDFIIYGGLGLLMLKTSAVVGIVSIAYGLVMADLQLYSQARQRQEKIQQTLPDFLDVLAVTVSAGLGFRHAVARVSESMPGALAEEFQTALRQMELGASRREAFDDLRTRNSSEALGQFVTALLQAEELGAPLAQALNEISVDMRREHAQWARRKAQKINPRITIVTMATILPGLIILIVGAMFLGSSANFGNVFGS